MALPEHWWLLGLAVIGQAAFFARFALCARLGAHSADAADAPARLPGWALAALALGAICGLIYAWLRRDPVMAAGQAGILLLAWIGRNRP